MYTFKKWVLRPSIDRRSIETCSIRRRSINFSFYDICSATSDRLGTIGLIFKCSYPFFLKKYMLPRQGEMGENTPFTRNVGKRSLNNLGTLGNP